MALAGGRGGVVVAAESGEDDAGDAGEGARDPGAVVAEGLPGRCLEVEGTGGAAGGRKTDGEGVADPLPVRGPPEVRVGAVGVIDGDRDDPAGDGGVQTRSVAGVVLAFRRAGGRASR
jgi:hypothetical protein